jgi:hypothetical protein
VTRYTRTDTSKRHDHVTYNARNKPQTPRWGATRATKDIDERRTEDHVVDVRVDDEGRLSTRRDVLLAVDVQRDLRAAVPSQTTTTERQNVKRE